LGDDLHAALDRLFLPARQRRIFDRLECRQSAQEIAKIAGERMTLKADGVGREGAA